MEERADDLFLLIKSMTRSEKRYFKVQTSRKQDDGKESNYIRLFDAIDRQSIYSEDKLITQFAGEVFIKHLPSEKNYLYNSILRVLHKFHAGTSSEVQVNQLLHEAEILFDKGLYDQSEKQLSKARKLIEQHELYYLMIKLTKLQIRISSQSSTSVDKMIKRMEGALLDSKQSVEKLNNQAAYIDLYIRFFVLIRTEGEQVRDEKNALVIQQILENELLKDSTLAESSVSKEIFHFIHYISLHILGKYEESFNYFKKYVSTNPNLERKRLEFSDEMSQKANACEICLKIQRYDEVEKLLEEIKQMNPSNFLQEGKQFHRYFSLKLTLLNEQKRFDESIALVEEIKKGLKTYEGIIHKSKILLINYQIAYAYFGVKQYKQSVTWINKIINDSGSDLRKDILCYARLLNLMVHSELKDYNHLEYLIQSSRYFLLSREKLHKTETVLIKYFRKLINASSVEDEREITHKLYEELVTFQKEDYEAGIFKAIGIMDWVQQKLS